MNDDRETITLPLDVVVAYREDRHRQSSTAALIRAIDAALWKPPPPAHIVRVSCVDHPHPIDGTPFLSWMGKTFAGKWIRGDPTPECTHWAPMPTWDES